MITVVGDFNKVEKKSFDAVFDFSEIGNNFTLEWRDRERGCLLSVELCCLLLSTQCLLGR